MDWWVNLFADAQQALFEQVVGPLTFALGLGQLQEDAFDATGWLLVGLLQMMVLVAVIGPLQRWRPVEAVTDRATQRVAIMASSEGGMDIEDGPPPVRYAVGAPWNFRVHKLRAILEQVESDYQWREKVIALAQRLVRTAAGHDCTTIEINPLVRLADGALIAADAKVARDEWAHFRNAEIHAEREAERHQHPDGEYDVRNCGWRLGQYAEPFLPLAADVLGHDGDVGVGKAHVQVERRGERRRQRVAEFVEEHEGEHRRGGAPALATDEVGEGLDHRGPQRAGRRGSGRGRRPGFCPAATAR